jgi:hypothetical protein
MRGIATAVSRLRRSSRHRCHRCPVTCQRAMKAMMGLGSAGPRSCRRLPGSRSSRWNKARQRRCGRGVRRLAGLGGLYLAECAISANVAPYAVDPNAEQLWTISERLCGSTAV